MAGHLAQEAPALLTAARGSAPPLIVLNGASSPASEIEEECSRTFEVFGDTSMDAALDAVRAKGLFAGDALHGAPQRTVDEIRGVLRHAAVRLLIEDVASTDDLEESAAPLVDHYIGWLAHLVAAHNNTAPRWNGETPHVISRDHPYREDWPGASATGTVVVECERDRLLGTPATREAILGFLFRA
ncbi:hypothetical protein [Streptomyces fuscichromogenes]|uniref:Uncharacterized protein n=1 Tax=Streptomyces fuscichromogenes TaxID=1324013 RepID=A0A917XP23_9ACTN|nr:hypothetical protein [Streptomyces fuscichromogenes]GGN45584.1 hypothetical protein GCM10011578_097680 [Streptomyces fuscichromogenes]